MGNQFSFYQYDGLVPGATTITPFAYTGANGNRVVVWGGAVTPVTAPYYNSFIGYYITPSLLEGGVAGFLWELFNDSSTYPSTFKAKISGEANSSNLHQVSFNNNIYGFLYPLLKESGQMGINLSGEVKQDNNQSPFAFSYSGIIPSGTKDFPVNAVNYSGQTISGAKDFFAIGNFISGSIISNNNDRPVYVINFSGSINHNNRDVGDMSCNFNSVSYSLYVVNAIIISTGDTTNMNTQFSTVKYEYHP